MDGLLFDTESIYERAAFAAAAESRLRAGLRPSSTHRRLSWRCHPRRSARPLWRRLRGRRSARRGAGRIFSELRRGRPAVEARRAGAARSARCARPAAGHRHVVVARDRPPPSRRPTAWSIASTMSWRHDDCERHKPDPDPFLKAAGLLGVAPAALPRCSRIPTSVSAAASAAGMMTIMIPDLLPSTDGICARRRDAAIVLDRCTMCARLDRHRTGDRPAASRSG